MNDASPVYGAVSITGTDRLPNGVGVLQVAYDGTYGGFIALPAALVFQGNTYGRSSHNSDTMRVTYRTDRVFAVVA